MSTIEEAKLLVERRGLVEANRRAKRWSSTVGERWKRVVEIDRSLSAMKHVDEIIKAMAKSQVEYSKECRMPTITPMEQTRKEIQAISDAWGMQVVHPGLTPPRQHPSLARHTLEHVTFFPEDPDEDDDDFMTSEPGMLHDPERHNDDLDNGILDEIHPQLGTTLRQNIQYDLANRPV
jgi:hypothetical protein